VELRVAEELRAYQGFTGCFLEDLRKNMDLLGGRRLAVKREFIKIKDSWTIRRETNRERFRSPGWEGSRGKWSMLGGYPDGEDRLWGRL